MTSDYMRRKKPLTKELARQHFDYEPETGRLFRLPDRTRQLTFDDYGYVWLGLGNNRLTGQRLIWLWMTGELPKGQVRVINGNKRDLRWANLRLRKAAFVNKPDWMKAPKG
jgi:hypothetical protein